MFWRSITPPPGPRTLACTSRPEFVTLLCWRRYAHFSASFQDVRGSTPSEDCIVAHRSYAYDNFTGDSNE